MLRIAHLWCFVAQTYFFKFIPRFHHIPRFQPWGTVYRLVGGKHQPKGKTRYFQIIAHFQPYPTDPTIAHGFNRGNVNCKLYPTIPIISRGFNLGEPFIGWLVANTNQRKNTIFSNYSPFSTISHGSHHCPRFQPWETFLLKNHETILAL